MRTRACFSFSLLVLLALRSIPGSAYTPTTTSQGIPLRWANGTVIQYVFNENFAPNNDNELVRAAIGDALRTLEASISESSGVRFEDAGTTPVNKGGKVGDSLNLITFTSADPDDQLDEFVLARARTFFNDLTGEIVEVDMVFNTTKVFSTSVSQEDVFDIQSLALHEAGHWLGLNHTGIAAAVMSPFGEGGQAPVRRLHSDDTAGLTATYGVTGGAISGLISTTGGQAVKSAHVVATNATTGVTTASAASDPDGSYRIVGLPAGSYQIFVEPLDDPVSLSNLSGFYQDGNDQFETTFLTNPETITMAEVSGVNIQVATPSAANLRLVALLMADGSFFRGGVPISVRRGTDNSIVLDGDNLSGQVRLSSPKVTLNDVQTIQTTAGPLNLADVSVAADAALGATDIYFGSSSFTGGLVVTLNPQVPADGIVDGAAFNQNTSAPHYAPGSIISLFGNDLAEQIAGPDRTPLPTQLAGVSVLVGNRLAPLFFVSAVQINAMIPFETTGNSVDVSVVAGSDSQSTPVTLQLGSSAPRIFMVPNTDQGAILNGSRNDVLVDAANPAQAGDVITIFGTGLGAVTNPPASGVAAPSAEPFSRTIATPSVTIGGQAAAVPFSGLAPFFVGLYQVNATVPGGLTPGRVPVVIGTSAGSSNQAMISVQ